MVRTIGTIHAIEARENMIDARAHYVSSYVNSTAPLSFQTPATHAGSIRTIAIAPNPHCVKVIATIT